MGREELRDDSLFATNAARVANMDETDALVAAWTRTLGKMEVFARAKACHVPCAPVRTAPEVMNDPHTHGRGMLERMLHPELGDIVMPSTPLRLHGTDKVETRPSPKSAQKQVNGAAGVGIGMPEARGTMAQACWWRLVAEEIRTEADNFGSESAKETMEIAARGWEQLAEELERRLARSSSQEWGYFC